MPWAVRGRRRGGLEILTANDKETQNTKQKLKPSECQRRMHDFQQKPTQPLGLQGGRGLDRMLAGRGFQGNP